MKRVLGTCLIALMISPALMAQNGKIFKANELMGQDKLAEAETVINEVLDNPKTTKWAKALQLAGDIQTRILNVEIFKAAKKLPCDTTLFVNALNKAVAYYKESDKRDHEPDKKGRVEPEFVESNRKKIQQVMPYYMYAGQFLHANGDQDGAYKAFNEYINLPADPIFPKSFTDSIRNADKDNYYQVAYYATIIAFQQKKWDNVLAQVDFALQDTVNLSDLYLMKTTALLEKKDTAQWITTTKEAIKRIPENTNYSANLLSYYMIKEDTTAAIKMGDDFVAEAPKSPLAWYARGTVYLNMVKDYSKALSDFQKAVELDSTYAEAEANLAITYINDVVSQRDKFTTNIRNVNYKRDYEKMLSYYRKAKPHAERARMLAPDKPRLWAVSLANIYENLNEKTKMKEMTTIINQMTSGK